MSASAQKSGVLKYELLLMLASVIWGTTFVAQQIGMEKGLGPMTFNGLRFTLGSLSLLPVLYWRRSHSGSAEKAGEFPLKGSILAGLFLFAAAGFQQVGLQYTTSANAGFITGFYMVFVPLFGIALGHRAARSLWMGIVICMIGFYLLSVTDGFAVGKGDLLILVCAVLWAGQILTIDHLVTKADPIKVAFLQFVICAVLSLIAGAIFETFTIDALRGAAGAVLYAGIASVGVAFTLQVVCQKHCPPAPAAVIMSMEAVFAAITGYVILDQTLTMRGIVGCVLIFAGMLVVQLVPLWRRKVPGS
jgi:drug/metabolite transporter (DMT)-like permease